MSKLAVALGVALASAGSAMAATIDFESVPVGTYNVLNQGPVQITFLAGNGNFEVQNQTPAPPVGGHVLISFFTNAGPGSYQATFAGGANSVSIQVSDYMPSDTDFVHLRAYDAANNLLDSDDFLIPECCEGTTLTVSSATPIARVEWNETGDFEGAVYWDNLSYESRVTAVPEPESYALMGLGLALTGFMVRRRREVR